MEDGIILQKSMEMITVYNNIDPAKYIHKKRDFLVRGLHTGTQQKVGELLDDISGDVEYLAEKDLGYPKFKEEDFSEEYIKLTEEEFAEGCAKVNAVLREAGRPPFFTDPEDTCRSAKEFLDLEKKRPYEELIAFFGVSSFSDYKPTLLS